MDVPWLTPSVCPVESELIDPDVLPQDSPQLLMPVWEVPWLYPALTFTPPKPKASMIPPISGISFPFALAPALQPSEVELEPPPPTEVLWLLLLELPSVWLVLSEWDVLSDVPVPFETADPVDVPLPLETE